MESEKQGSLIIILGPTCAGKSAAALDTAKRFSGEIINCDSMQVYKGFDIGTDKIPPDQRENIPHHLLDIVSPSDQFTAADFVRLALDAISDIQTRHNLPIIAGGTGLYLKALLVGLFPQGKSDPQIRRRLEAEAQNKGLDCLEKRLQRVDSAYAAKIGTKDRIRIIRALEVYEATGKPLSSHFSNTHSFVDKYDVLTVGLTIARPLLYARIEKRVDRMFEGGLVSEVQGLLDAGVDEKAAPFRALGYKHVLQYLKNEISLDEAVQMTKQDTRHYAKRQMTWFRKMEGIQWLDPEDRESLFQHVEKFLLP